MATEKKTTVRLVGTVSKDVVDKLYGKDKYYNQSDLLQQALDALDKATGNGKAKKARTK